MGFSTMDVSIIITNYHTAHFTPDAINSIRANVEGLKYEIILVENGSDEFNEELIRQFGWQDVVKLIVTEKNLGFAGGNNLGIQYATGKYIILLNSDTILKENVVLKTFKHMESHPEIGVLSARLIFPDGSIQCAAQRFPSIKYNLYELFRIQKILPKKSAGRILLGAFFDHSETVEADWVWGTYFMFPRKILEQLPGGKLDDEFVMYCEDIQWCMDIRRLGYKVCFFAEGSIVHLMGGSSKSKKEVSAAGKEKLIKKHHLMLLKKNYPAWKVFLIRLTDRMLGK
jgi:GT2 family glycosyltransferase